MKTAPIWKALYGNKVPSNVMVHGASKSFIWNILHSIHFCPIKSLQSKDLERALPILLPYLEPADDVTLKWASSALCPSREIVEGPCSSTVRWHQQQVPITQPILEATLTKDYQIAVQGWSKKPKGCRGTRSTLTSQGQTGIEVQPQQNCYSRETEQLPDPRAAALPEVKEGKKT